MGFPFHLFASGAFFWSSYCYQVTETDFSHLQTLRIALSCYIDDCIFLATSKDLIYNVRYALQLFNEHDLTVQVSWFSSPQVVEFLGVVLDSVTMTATLPPQRRDCIKRQGALLLWGDPNIHDLVSFIDLAMTSEMVVALATL